MAIKPLFTKADISARLRVFMERTERAIIETLKYVGEGWVTDARSIRTYKDRTGNLRSSTGYLILINNRIVCDAFNKANTGTAGQEGVETAREFAKKLAKQFKGKRIVFIGVAGMEYAVAVEAKGYDVITGSSERAKKVLEKQLKRITKK